MAEKIKGLKKLNEQLEALKGIKTSKALLAGAFTLQRYSMENSPVKTGFLRQSHESIEVDDHAEMLVNANYAYYQEFGTKTIPAKGFIRKAIDEHTDDVTKAVGRQMQKDIKDAL